jgi:glycosyltransferase involved in cell wall biosynthesis
VSVESVTPSWAGRSANPVKNAVRDAWWDLRGAAKAADSPDLLVSPCNIGGAHGARRHLLVVYDVMVFENPEFFDPKYSRYFRSLVPRSVRRADRVLTLSQHARQQLLQMAPDADIRVMTLPGREKHPSPARRSERRTVLMVGWTEPIKNQAAGIKAVAALRKRSGLDLALRIIGPVGRAEDDVRSLMAQYDPSGTWTTRESDLTDSQVDDAYGSAWVLLQPSINEGYGLPLVEAAQRGLPVVHSGAGAMNEVIASGNAGSADPAPLAAAMEPLIDNLEWHRQSTSLLLEAQRFSWDLFPQHVAALVDGLLPTPSVIRREDHLGC